MKLYILFLSLVRNICFKLNIVILYESRAGIKYTAPIMPPVPCESKGQPVQVSIDDLFIGFDFLNDRYSLLGIPVTRSPHADLMNLFSNNQSIMGSEYVKRHMKGTLDIRIPMLPKIDIMIERFNRSRESVGNKDYEPVSVYKIEGRYYIRDGKHRAALCACMGHKTVSCRVITTNEIMADRFTWWMYAKLKRGRKGYYSRHMEFFNHLIKEHC